jgi:hypothetical protein
MMIADWTSADIPFQEYAAEAFILEEEANGKTWMIDKAVST